MSYVTLAKPDIALFSNVSGTRVVLPRMSGQGRKRTFEQSSVRFEGDNCDTTFRGQGRGRQYSLRVRFTGAEHATMASLLALFDMAQDAADGRLQLRTNAFSVAGLNPLEVVTVSEIDEQPVGGLAWDVSFTASTVEYTLAV